MSKIETAKQMLTTNIGQIPYAIFRNLSHKGILNWLPDKLYIQIAFKLCTGKKLNLLNPRTFNEKIQWLKLYDRKPEYTLMVDKYRVRDYIEKIIGSEHLIPLLGVWESVEDIDFESLPNQFVLKCNHDSGSVIICQDKSQFNKEDAQMKLKRALNTNGYWFAREWPYKNVRPCIIAEKYLCDDTETELRDYKFYCFNGQPKYCQVIADRRSNETIDFYDMDWNWMNFTGNQYPFKPHSSSKQDAPVTFSEMKDFSKKLSKGLPFARIDYYCVKGKTYFGEITLYPAGGFGTFSPEEWNQRLGDMIKLH